jgi:VWFA-related protein
MFLAPPEVANKPGYIELKVSVTNRSGGAIPGLKRDDFIADTSGTHLPIAFFAENVRAPIAIGVLIDTSGSMAPKLSTVQLKLSEFINDLSPSDEVSLIAFSTQPHLLQPLTTDHPAVLQELSLLHGFGQTSIYDSIVLAVGKFNKTDLKPKAILLITDGMDNASSVKEPDAVRSLKATDVKIYAIGIGDPTATDMPGIALGPFIFGGDVDHVDAKALQDMARDAGGEAFIVPPVGKDDGKGFGKAVKTISNMISATYTIGVVVPAGVSATDLRIAIAKNPTAVVTTHIVNRPVA